MIIEDLMKKPIVIERDLTLTEAAKLIIKHNISSLVVVSGRAVIGIITYEDLVRHFGEQKKVFEIMTKQVITVKKSDKVQKAKEITLTIIFSATFSSIPRNPGRSWP